MFRFPSRLRRILGIVIGAMLYAAAAHAASFTLNPTEVVLKSGSMTALLTLKNENTRPLRFQITAFKWDQDATGNIVLTETTDVIFFPKLLTLNAGEERKLRIGTTAIVGAVEQTYRLFVEELPDDAPTTASMVRVRTRMGIPIFVQPTKASAAAGNDGARRDERRSLLQDREPRDGALCPGDHHGYRAGCLRQDDLHEDLQWLVHPGRTRADVFGPLISCGAGGCEGAGVAGLDQRHHIARLREPACDRGGRFRAASQVKRWPCAQWP